MIKPYIKSETAEEIICSICDRMYPGMDCEPADCEWMKMLAEEAVDAVPVVRCKDCKYRDGTPGQPNILCAQMHEDDFCSYGERRAEKEPPEEGET
jgi:hypothetical protein